MSDDVVFRAKAAMEKYPRMGSQYEDDRFIGIMRGLVPELIAEIEKLRKSLAYADGLIEQAVDEARMFTAPTFGETEK